MGSLGNDARHSVPRAPSGGLSWTVSTQLEGHFRNGRPQAGPPGGLLGCKHSRCLLRRVFHQGFLGEPNGPRTIGLE